MSTPILQAEKITKRFGAVTALRDVTFDLRAGEIHALCGENGAGKSTLIKTLSGIHPAGSYDGRLLMEGKPVAFKSTKDAEAHGLAVIYQELAMVPEMSVAENIFLGQEPMKRGLVDWLTVVERAKQLLQRFKLDIDPEARVGELGVGQQQLVEIVKALSKRSRLLILDEPTAALSDTEVGILLDILRGLRADGVTCVYISHRLEEVLAISDRVTVLRDGQTIETLETAGLTQADIIRRMVGREITELFPRRATAPGEPMLTVKGLAVRRPGDGKQVLHDVTFDVRSGEVLGIGGLMGAGRTELLMHLFGAFGKRTAGSVTLRGTPLADPPHRAIERGLVLVSEDRKRYGLILDRDIGFNMSLSSLRAVVGPAGLIREDAEVKRNQAMFKSLRVKAPDLDTVVGGLSGGNQQKVVLGKALLTQPKVIFLDEPTRGIDVGAKVEVYELVNQLTAAGQAVVLVSSELPELMGMSDRIAMLHEGTVGGIFTRAEATAEKLMAAALGHTSDERVA
ncbi:MAG: sugar ABC transporter ATP-binding protein [Deltaproteobacteria bacterium]|nr:sugar ABC transporter ATP-binding protein [Deltaproteobacteria bacterium]MDQ3298178.1 sugar ABC transporter ATP-binding protein [Myxococcota bacterium]